MAVTVQTYLDFGAYGLNSHFGAPYALNLGWASTVDDVHIWMLTALGAVTSDPYTVMALYFFLCFPLSALTMYWLCRRYSIAKPAAVVLGVLFSVVPGHQERFMHLFLAAYWAVPFAIFLIIESARGRSVLPAPSRSKGDPLRARVAPFVFPVVMLILIGLGTVYYTAFTALMVVTVAVVRQFAGLNLREMLRLALPVVIMMIPAAVSIYFARIRAAQDEITGSMAFGRTVADSDRWSGRFMDLILPWSGHRIPVLGRLSDSYNVLTNSQGEPAALGIVALIGVVAVLGVAGAHALRGQRGHASTMVPALAVTILAALAFYTKGGLGSWFALFFTPQIRTWSRLFLFIAAIGYLGVGLALTKLARSGPRWVAWPTALAILVIGVWDQTNPGRAPDYAEQKAHLSQLREFSDSVESAVGAGCGIFVLPVVQYPEVADESVPELMSLGAASHDLRWSFGAIRGTAQADWQLGLAATNPSRLLDDLSAVGFCGVMADGSLAQRLPTLAQALPEQLGRPVATSTTVHFTAYDLRQRTTKLMRALGSSGMAARRYQVLHPAVVSVQGVWRMDELGSVRYPMGPTPTLQLSNMSNRTITVDLGVHLVAGRDARSAFTLRADGATSPTIGLTDGSGGDLALRVQVPPGQSSVRLDSPGALDDVARYQNRSQVAYITNVTATSNDPAVNVNVSLPQP